LKPTQHRRVHSEASWVKADGIAAKAAHALLQDRESSLHTL